ncbi:MAG: LPS export ABC transporter periplasmic protein LptC [Bacillota bacterium]
MENNRFIIFLIIIVCMTGLLAGCEDRAAEETEEPAREEEVEDRLDEPGQEIRSGSMNLYSEDGETQWKLESEVIRQLERSGELELEPLDVEAFLAEDDDFSEAIAYWLESDAGFYQEEEGILKLLGSARLESEQYTFISENIEWDQTDNIISSQGDTEIRTDEFTARGGSFEATGDLKTLRIYRSEDNQARVKWEAEEDGELD